MTREIQDQNLCSVFSNPVQQNFLLLLGSYKSPLFFPFFKRDYYSRLNWLFQCILGKPLSNLSTQSPEKQLEYFLRLHNLGVLKLCQNPSISLALLSLFLSQSALESI